MKSKLSKRKLIASLGTCPLWVKPVMQSVIMPVHAQTSNGLARITNAIVNCGSGVNDLTNGKSVSITVDFYVEMDAYVSLQAHLFGEPMPSDLMYCQIRPTANNLANRVEQRFNRGRHIIDVPLFAIEEDTSGITFSLNSISVHLYLPSQHGDSFEKSISCRAIGVGYLDCPSA